ncbi:GNAT family N-acetyltransferase [Priestia koreensis]|uniref:GNAT family N-acetyltransferase n=1 Tax=Priestia koreensis TaxID=284581 RepID=UPI003459A909
MITVKELDLSWLPRIKEIDRTEEIEAIYTYKNETLAKEERKKVIPNWSPEGISEIIHTLSPIIKNNGHLVGAIDQDRLIGVAVLGGEWLPMHEKTLQMAFLYVSNGYRRQKVAQRLMDHVVFRVKEKGAMQLYVSATETNSALGFYFRYGFTIAKHVDPALFLKEPLDIHLIMPIK